MDFVKALEIAKGVLEQYRQDQPKWWKRMDGTPILNDVAVRMAEAFIAHDEAEKEAAKPRCMKGEPCECTTNCGDDNS